MESFLTAVSDLIPALQKHRAKFRNEFMIPIIKYDMTHNAWLIAYESYAIKHTWISESLLVTFICFSVGSAFCMEGGFHTFKVSPPQKRNQTQPHMIFFRFLIVLVPLDLHYCGFHFGSRLQSDGDMVVTNIFVTLDECVKQSVTHTSNTAFNILLPSSLWWVFPNLIWPKPNPYSYPGVSHTRL